MLSDAQIERYSRQIILPQVGGTGQERLLAAKVLVHAGGPLHASALHYLAAAGVGTLGIFADADDTILTVLASDPGQKPASVLTSLNPDCSVVEHQPEERRFARSLVEQYHVVIADSEELHDTCRAIGRPFLYAEANAEDAWLAVFRDEATDAACLRCAGPLSHEDVASPLSSITALFLGAQLATEALKLLLGLPQERATQRLWFHIPTFACRLETVQKEPGCGVCGAAVNLPT